MPEGLSWPQQLNWFARNDIALPTVQKGGARGPQSKPKPNTPRHAGEPRDVTLNRKPTLQRKFGESKFQFKPFPFNPDGLFTMTKYGIDSARPAKDDQDRAKRKDSAMGSAYVDCLDRDEDMRPCHYVHGTNQACPYPDNNESLANHNVTRDQFFWLILERNWPIYMVNYLINHFRLETPRDMLPQNRLKLFPPRDQINEATPKGNMTEAEIDEWRRAHRIVARNNDSELVGRKFGQDATDFVDKVRQDDAELVERAKQASLTERRPPPTITSLGTSIHAPTSTPGASGRASNPPKGSKLAARQARRHEGDKPE